MESNNNRLVLYGAGAVALLVLVLGGAWFVAPFLQGEPEPPKPVAAAPAKAQGRPARAARPQLGGGPVVYASDEGGAGPSPRGKAGGARSGARAAGREDRAAAFNSSLDEYARAKGWDQQTTDEVRNVVMETVKGAREAIGEARQAHDREALRSGLQQLRTEQAQQLEAILGPDESTAFVQSMNVGQYFPRVAERRGAKAGGGGGPQ